MRGANGCTQASIEAFSEGPRSGLRIVVGGDGAHARDTADLTAIGLAGAISPDGQQWIDIDRSYWDEGRKAWCSAIYFPGKKTPELSRRLSAMGANYLGRRGFAAEVSAGPPMQDPRPTVEAGLMGVNATCPMHETARLADLPVDVVEVLAVAPRALLEPKRVTVADLIGGRARREESRRADRTDLEERPIWTDDPAKQRYCVFNSEAEILHWYEGSETALQAMRTLSRAVGTVTREGLLLGWRTPYDVSSAQARAVVERIAHKILIRLAIDRRLSSGQSAPAQLRHGRTT